MFGVVLVLGVCTEAVGMVSVAFVDTFYPVALNGGITVDYGNRIRHDLHKSVSWPVGGGWGGGNVLFVPRSAGGVL